MFRIFLFLLALVFGGLCAFLTLGVSQDEMMLEGMPGEPYSEEMMPGESGPEAEMAPDSGEAAVPEESAEVLIETRCTVCHSRQRIDNATKTSSEWSVTIARMVGYGANLNAAERELLIDYLASR